MRRKSFEENSPFFQFFGALIFFLNISLFTPIAAAQSKRGGSDTGGGGLGLPLGINSPQQVLGEFENMQPLLLKVKNAFERLYRLSKRYPQLFKSKDLSLIESVFKNPNYNSEFSNSTYLMDQRCFESEKSIYGSYVQVETDGSAKIGDVGGQICLNKMSLARFPRAALPDQIIALAMHEHMHHLGYTEEMEPNQIQTLLLQNAAECMHDKTSRAMILARAQSLIKELSKKVEQCFTIGGINREIILMMEPFTNTALYERELFMTEKSILDLRMQILTEVQTLGWACSQTAVSSRDILFKTGTEKDVQAILIKLSLKLQKLVIFLQSL